MIIIAQKSCLKTHENKLFTFLFCKINHSGTSLISSLLNSVIISYFQKFCLTESMKKF